MLKKREYNEKIPMGESDYDRSAGSTPLEMNYRMSSYKIAPLCLLCILSLAVCTACDRNGRWSKEWEEKFESFQPSEKIIEIMDIRPGMTVGEIGAGNGRLAVKIAAQAGKAGTVYANDIDPEAIRFMQERCEREKIPNMVVIHSKTTEPCFPMGALDLVYMINTYDHLDDPVALLRHTAPCLKPAGRLVIIATDSEKLKNHRGHATPRQVVIDQVTRAGFELVHMDTSFLYDNIYIFRPDNK